jgi:nitrogen fixation-related uncharacterized protein
MSYYAMFLLYLSVGILITFSLFVWAVKHGQFKDQARARYLALDGINPLPQPEKKTWPKEVIATLAIAFAGLAIMLTLATIAVMTG